MATHDYVLANQSGSSFRTDLNNALAAVVTNNSNATEPSTRYSYQIWADTNSGYLKIRNAANNAWVSLFKLDGTDLANICRLTGSTNNTICTVTGANAIQGEANLTYDGTQFNAGPALFALGNVSKTQDGVIIQRNTTSGAAEFIAGRSGGNYSQIETYVAGASGVTKRYHNLHSGEHEWFKEDGSTGVLKAETNGNLKIHDGDLVIGTAGHGIDFSAQTATTTTGSSPASELLAHYELGTWTPTFHATTTTGTFTPGITQGRYTRVGNLVHVIYYSSSINQSGFSGAAYIDGLPFIVMNTGYNYNPVVFAYTTAFASAAEGYASNNSTRLSLTTANSTSSVAWSNTNSTYLMFSLVYQTDF